MKKLFPAILAVVLFFACSPAAAAQEVLRAPSGSVQPAEPAASIDPSQVVQYVVYAVAIGVVAVLLVIRIRLKIKKDREE